MEKKRLRATREKVSRHLGIEARGNVTDLDLNSAVFISLMDFHDESFLEAIEDLELKFHLKLIYSKFKDGIEKIRNDIDKKDLEDLLLNGENLFYANQGRHGLSQGLSKLLVELLDIRDDDDVAVLQVENFSIMMSLANKNYRSLDIYESSIEKVLDYKMKNHIIENKLNIVEANTFNSDLNSEYSKILGQMRLNARLSEEQKNRLERKYKDISIGSLSSDWADILDSIGSLRKDGKLVNIVSNNALYSNRDRRAREYLLENRLVEALVELPAGSIFGCAVDISILVISRNNDRVRLVDSKDLFLRKDGNLKYLPEENIGKVIERIHEDTDYSRSLSIEEIRDEDYMLLTKLYLNRISLKKEVNLDEVIEKIDRGSNITNRELEGYISDTKTSYRFLNLVDIQNGRIEDTAIYLREDIIESNEKLDKLSSLEPGQVLLSRIGSPIRIAVVEDLNNEKWFFSGNIYAISLDRKVYDPYYLKAFLESEVGRNILEKAYLGSSIPSIGIKNLRDIKIPNTSMEKQLELVDFYRTWETRLRELELKLEELSLERSKKLDRMFEETIES